MRRMVAMALAAALNVLCRDEPEAIAADARDLFRGISRFVDYPGLGDGEGGMRLSIREVRRLQ